MKSIFVLTLVFSLWASGASATLFVCESKAGDRLMLNRNARTNAFALLLAEGSYVCKKAEPKRVARGIEQQSYVPWEDPAARQHEGVQDWPHDIDP